MCRRESAGENRQFGRIPIAIFGGPRTSLSCVFTCTAYSKSEIKLHTHELSDMESTLGA